jgi:hypothetical protein
VHIESLNTNQRGRETEKRKLQSGTKWTRNLRCRSGDCCGYGATFSHATRSTGNYVRNRYRKVSFCFLRQVKRPLERRLFFVQPYAETSRHHVTRDAAKKFCEGSCCGAI